MDQPQRSARYREAEFDVLVQAVGRLLHSAQGGDAASRSLAGDIAIDLAERGLPSGDDYSLGANHMLSTLLQLAEHGRITSHPAPPPA